MKDSEKNHIDEWLQKQIKKGISTIESVLQNEIGEWKLYYIGHLHKDILSNFPGRTSKNIFKGYRQFLDNDNLTKVFSNIGQATASHQLAFGIMHFSNFPTLNTKFTRMGLAWARPLTLHTQSLDYKTVQPIPFQ